MSEKSEQVLYMHQAYWLIKQLHKKLSIPEWFLNFRCVQNDPPRLNPDTGRTEHPSKVTFDSFVEIRVFKDKWNEGLLNHLMMLNHAERPSNIYYSINPLKDQGHKKEFFAQFNSLFLDLDDSKSYTKEQRWMQVHYWIKMGLAPSFVIDSGHGYHVYWLLKRALSREQGEAILKNMVARSGGREGGNTFDISRVFRLPGFRNVKEWFNSDTPPCGIVWATNENGQPMNYDEIEDAITYDPETFVNFPPSEIYDLERYYTEAQRISNSPAEFAVNIERILKAAREAQNNLHVQQAADNVAVQAETNATTNGKTASWMPRLTVVPMADEIKWGRANGWMKKYCRLGHAAMTQGELDVLKMEQKFEDTSASQLDFAVIYALIKKGYTLEAVRDFWKRSEHKLFRADKEARNPNYFETSYNKALTYVKAAAEQKATAEVNVEVWADRHQTFVKMGDGKVECCLTGELKLNAIYEDFNATFVNERQFYDVTARCTDPLDPEVPVEINLFIPNSAFDSVPAFKKQVSNDLLRVTTNNNANLSRIAKHLLSTYRNAPRHQFHSRVVYKDKKFIFPTFVVESTGVTQRESLPMMEELAKKFPMFGQFTVKFLPKDLVVKQLRDHWMKVLTMHMPRVICSILGVITASAIKPILIDSLGIAQFHIPTINIRGASHTAKTETVRHLCTVMGIKAGKNVVAVGSSEFALSRYLAATNFIPILLDEFKDEGENSKQIANVRQIVRRIYSGEALLRGRADMSIYHMEMHGSMFVVGETTLERPGNIAEITRNLPVNTDNFRPADHRANWKVLRTMGWEELCPHFYQFLLNQDPKTMNDEVTALEDEIVEMITNHFGDEKLRVAHNLAVVWYGCKLFDKFILSMDPTLPTIEQVCNPRTSLVDYICDWADESGHALKIKEIDPVTKKVSTRVVSSNEFLTMLKTYGTLLEIRDDTVRKRIQDNVFTYEEREDDLYINLQTMYNTYAEYIFKTTRVLPTCDLMKMKSLAKAAFEKKEPWIKNLSRVVWTANGSVRVVTFKLSTLRELNVWPRSSLLTPSNDPQLGKEQADAESTT
jgi:hypothetical protein